jgi:dTMP kinase
MSMRGKFLTVEGVEGVGKTTNIQFIKEWLDLKNISYICSREPGGTPFAEEIRDLLLNPRDEVVCNKAELLLMFAARAQHLEQTLEPQLDAGNWVLCDRFTDATYAYQGAGRHMDNQMIANLESMVQGNLKPDLTLILDISPEQGLQRANKRGSLDRFEREEIEFFERVREAYQLIAKREPLRCVTIDASLSLPQVQLQIKDALESFWLSLGSD